ncbi:eukaryotic aspartyl protease domain-containing protein [Sarocladium implicatum]|nr:eukaryotic aspartyl protease domain-containing protein [Sarocladium implicatum]
MAFSSPVLRGLSNILLLALFAPIEAQVVQWDIHRQEIGSELQRRADHTYEETITNEKGRGGYFASAQLGNPPQNITLQLDTASSDIWVPYSGAAICRSKSLRREPGCYLGIDPDESRTYEDFEADTFDISYVDQNYAKGDYFQDDFQISGAKVKNLTMGLGLQSSLAYGLLGVGYAINEASISTAGFMYPNLPIAMLEGGFINTIAYSLWLNDLGASTGNILFGGVDQGKYSGEMIRVGILKDKKVDNYTHFSIPMTSLEATSPTGTDVLSGQSPIEVILDSGTTLSYLPFDMAKLVWDEVGATYNSKLEMAVLPCSYADHPGYFSFGFAGEDGPRINITMDELVIDLTNGSPPEFTSGEYEGQRVCQFGIQRSYASPWTLGDTFLRSAYVVYDLENNEIGIAATDFNSTQEKIVAFESQGAKIPSATLASTGIKAQDNPRPTSTTLSAAHGFQNKDEGDNGQGRGGNGRTGSGGDKDDNNNSNDNDDDEDAACIQRALSGPSGWILAIIFAYLIVDSVGGL